VQRQKYMKNQFYLDISAMLKTLHICQQHESHAEPVPRNAHISSSVITIQQWEYHPVFLFAYLSQIKLSVALMSKQ
jgi:hypothetical protein